MKIGDTVKLLTDMSCLMPDSFIIVDEKVGKIDGLYMYVLEDPNTQLQYSYFHAKEL